MKGDYLVQVAGFLLLELAKLIKLGPDDPKVEAIRRKAKRHALRIAANLGETK